MLLTSVILILQEILEAAMLISILAVISRQQQRQLTWLPAGLLSGGILALLYAANMRSISEWFDYVGQEVVNAALQVSIALAIVLLTWLVCAARARGSLEQNRPGTSLDRRFVHVAALTISLAVTREGSEIAVYLGGFMQQPDKLQAVLTGSAIGAGIGISFGFLIYYGLLALRGRHGAWLPLLLLGLFCGNMLSQSALQLTQADLLPAGPFLWDSSAWLPESSVIGRLLYALVGYESRPSALEVCAYLLGVSAVLVSAALARIHR
jgi:high-affinity iron transporter